MNNKILHDDPHDDKLRRLFSDFNPGLPSGNASFMTRLLRNMESVELLRAHNLKMRRRNRRAITAAFAAGIISGSLLTALLPLLAPWLARAAGWLLALIPAAAQLSPAIIADSTPFTVVLWCAVAAIATLSAWQTYNFTLSLSPKSETEM